MEELAINDMFKNLEERQSRLTDGVTKLKKSLAKSNTPEAYKDERCKKPNQWVYLYPDGHEELVEIDTASMIANRIKEK